MEWNVREDMVDELIAAGVAGIATKLQAMLVFQHCTVHSMSVFDFVEKFRVDGMRIVPAESGSAAAAAGPGRSAMRKPVGVVWKYQGWRDEQLAVNRLEMLRKHIAEVQADDPGNSWLGHLREQAAQLARVVEGQPTLGMVADDAEEVEPKAESGKPDELQPELNAAVEAECIESFDCANGDHSDACPMASHNSPPEDIGALLQNPSAVQPAKAAEEIRKDARGRVLASSDQLSELYELGTKLGMSRSVVEDNVCKSLKVPKVDQAPRDLVSKVIEKMRARIGVA